MRFDLLAATSILPQAGQILSEAWPGSGLRHSTEYLAWQFGFPGAANHPAAISYDGQEPVGFAGVTTRDAWYLGAPLRLALVSFVAVRPPWQRRGVATRLYALLLGELARVRANVLTFALAESPGEQTLIRSYKSAGFEIHPMGTYPSYACQPRPSDVKRRFETTFAGESDFADGVDAVMRLRIGDRTIRADWTGPQLAQYRSDPRARENFIVRDDNARVSGVGWLVRSEWNSPDGAVRGTTLDSVALPNDDPEALAAILQYAGSRWRDQADQKMSKIVVAPNLNGMSQQAISRAGLRRIPTTYRGYICCLDPQSPLLKAEGTNIEIT